jgi:molecular chaperone Hsp33
MILTELSDPSEKHLSSIAADGMDIFMLQDGGYRGALLHGTRLVTQMAANHRLGVMETLILGHAYLAGGLLTSLVKGNDRIQFDITSDGPVSGLSIDANARGEIRGYLKNSKLDLTSEPETFDTAPYLGTGTLTVTRRLELAPRPVTGHVRFRHGAIARDLAGYFLESEQKPTALSVSIQFDRDGSVSGAGALFVQALPETDHSAAGDMDAAIENLPSLGTAFASGDTPAHFVRTHLSGFQAEIIGSRRIEFFCPCSRLRFARYLRSLPESEIEAWLTEGPVPAKVVCHYCASSYMYGRQELESFLSR